MNRITQAAAIAVLGLAGACVTPHSGGDGARLLEPCAAAAPESGDPATVESDSTLGSVLEDIWEWTLRVAENFIWLAG